MRRKLRFRVDRRYSSLEFVLKILFSGSIEEEIGSLDRFDEIFLGSLRRK